MNMNYTETLIPYLTEEWEIPLKNYILMLFRKLIVMFLVFN